MKKVTEEEIIKWTSGIKISKNTPVEVSSISTDSRDIKQGDFFVPIKGDNFNGNDFIEDVLQKGAIGAITDRDIDVDDRFIIKVKDTNQALLDIAEGYLRTLNIPIVAITGSVGKTTTKEMVHSVLSEKYKVLKTEGNYNNHVGLPKTVFNLDKTYDIAILEMGMNNLGEIERLSKVAKPDIALITNIGDSHIGNLGSKDGILQAKSEIFKYMKDRGVALLNGDDKYLRKIKLSNEIIYIGENKNNDCCSISTELINDEYTRLSISYNGEIVKLKVNTILDYIKYPVMFALVVGKRFGLTNEQIINGIEKFKMPSKRYGALSIKNNITIIDDCYNASLISIKSAVETTINGYASRRKVAILGDIFELGSFSEKKHMELGEYLASKPINMLVLIGKDIKYSYDVVKNSKEAYYFENKSEAYEFLREGIKENDVVLIKASNGNKFCEIVEWFKNNY